MTRRVQQYSSWLLLAVHMATADTSSLAVADLVSLLPAVKQAACKAVTAEVPFNNVPHIRHTAPGVAAEVITNVRTRPGLLDPMLVVGLLRPAAALMAKLARLSGAAFEAASHEQPAALK